MKVYTHFYPIDDNEGFRWRTLLQFGESWECIGSVVMKNPGTSKCISLPIVDKELLKRLSHYDASSDDWFEFNDDNTMKCVGDLFAFKYGKTNREELSGIIQIFNLFYIKDADLSNALRKSELYGIPQRFQSESEMARYDIEHLVSPVYLGFGDLAWSKKYGARAEEFYNAVKSIGSAGYLENDFHNNRFTHPQALMGYQKNNINSVQDRLRFREGCLHSDSIDQEMAQINSLWSIKVRVEAATKVKWWIYKNCDLGISVNDKSNRIGIESWFVEEDGKRFFQPYFTTWQKKCFIPYKEQLESLLPGCITGSLGTKSRVFLHLPKVEASNIELIVCEMEKYYSILKDLKE